MTKPVASLERCESAAAPGGVLHQTPTHLPVALIADHEEWSARSLESVLVPGGYAVARVRSGRQALAQVARTPPDLVFLADELPDGCGIALCQRLRGEGHVGDSTPILLMLPGPIPRERRLAALRAGAWALVGLPLDAEELLLRLGSLVRAKLEADNARAESLLDAGTGLYNVRGLLRRAREMGAEARRHRRPLGCAVFALDGTSDAEWRRRDGADRMVRLFQSVARGCDAVGRLGDHEFVVLAPGTDRNGVLQFAHRVVRAAQMRCSADVNESGPHALRAGCFAVADFAQANIEPVELLVRAAKALRALRENRASEQIRFFDPPVAAAPAGV